MPLGEALSSPDALADLLDDLGWEVHDLVPNIGLDPAHVDDLADAFEGVIDLHDGSPDDDTVVDAYARLVAAVAVLAEDIHDVRDMLADRLDAAFLTASGMADALPRRLFDHLAISWLAERNEPLYQAAVLIGVFELVDVPGDPATFTSQHVRKTIRLDRLRALFDDPAAVFRDVYGWGTPAADLALLLDRLGELGFSLGLDLELVIPPIEQDIALGTGCHRRRRQHRHPARAAPATRAPDDRGRRRPGVGRVRPVALPGAPGGRRRAAGARARPVRHRFDHRGDRARRPGASGCWCWRRSSTWSSA